MDLLIHFHFLTRIYLNFIYPYLLNIKFNNGYGRALFRESLKGIVPENIRLRTEKSGTTIPSVQKRMIRDFDKIKELIHQVQSRK